MKTDSVVLLDTGPLCAILNRSDAWHERCVSTLETIPGTLATTWACLAEAMYLVGEHLGWRGQEALWDMYWRRAFEVAEPTLHQMARIHQLMTKYRDQPMDLADATLVALAEERGINTIFTVDQKDFGLYRLHGRKGFKVLPA